MLGVNRIRWTGIEAMLGGVLLMMKAMLGSDMPPGDGDPMPYASFVVQILMLVGIIGLYARVSGTTGWMGRLGFLVGFFGVVLAIAARFVGPFAGFEMLAVTFAFHVSALSFGLVLLGLAAARSETSVRWRTIPLIVGLLGFVVLLGFGLPTIVPDQVSYTLFGAGWVLLGCALWTDRGQAPRPRLGIA